MKFNVEVCLWLFRWEFAQRSSPGQRVPQAIHFASSSTVKKIFRNKSCMIRTGGKDWTICLIIRHLRKLRPQILKLTSNRSNGEVSGHFQTHWPSWERGACCLQCGMHAQRSLEQTRQKRHFESKKSQTCLVHLWYFRAFPTLHCWHKLEGFPAKSWIWTSFSTGGWLVLKSLALAAGLCR